MDQNKSRIEIYTQNLLSQPSRFPQLILIYITIITYINTFDHHQDDLFY